MQADGSIAAFANSQRRISLKKKLCNGDIAASGVVHPYRGLTVGDFGLFNVVPYLYLQTGVAVRRLERRF